MNILHSPVSRTDTALTIFCAGSLRNVMTELVDTYQKASGATVVASFGPAGLMRGRIENGEAADVFFSADLSNPERLKAVGWCSDVVAFAGNRVCVIGAERVGLTPDNVLDKLLDPTVRVGTSTPLCDVSGDVAWEMFRKIDQVRPGSFAALDRKALKLVGGTDTMEIPSGQNAPDYLMSHDFADLFVGFYTTALDAQRRGSSMQYVEMPAELSVSTVYGYAAQSPDSDNVAAFLAHIRSTAGGDLLRQYGFEVAGL